MPSILFRFRRFLRQMWFLPALFSAMAVVTVVAARAASFLLPDEMPLKISQEGIQNILEIIAASMLTVAIFALATMVNAFAAASQNSTPRAVRLIIEDRTAQTSISAFLGAFLFSIVGIIALSSVHYSESGRLILFSATLLVVVAVVAALIQWIDQSSSIGRVGNTVDRVEAAATAAFKGLGRQPLFGCAEQTVLPEAGSPVHASRIGHVQQFYPARLQEIAEKHALRIHVNVRPGAYATPLRPLAIVEGIVDDERASAIRDAFVVGDERTFDDDPRFGLIVLSEIASRALSPSVNDPGTAIEVIETTVRILAQWVGHVRDGKGSVDHPDVTVAPISADDIIGDAFRPIARDGAGTLEVCLKLIVGLRTLTAISPDFLGPAAARMATDVSERAKRVMTFAPDVEAVKAMVGEGQM
jgi:uncharacterized membrane protein